MPGLDHRGCCAALPGAIARLAAVVAEADPTAPVPTCPDWTIADLAGHAGTVHRWAGRMVRERATERLDRSTIDFSLPPATAEGADWGAWLAAGADPLVAILTAAGGDESMWAWGPDQHVRFWSRRMVHETTVHRADAELATGIEPAVDPVIAVDGVEELLANLPHSGLARRVGPLAGGGELVHVRVTDVAAEWTIRLGADGFTWRAGPPEPGVPTVAVGGAVTDVLLLLYGRRPLDDRFSVEGDRDPLVRMLDRCGM